ncbi:PH domain-containing protein [Tautonia marina]|uniref:PH domain-containing protein n=1 Tax=Tautonia marina TaxID=2653855 RepID=UPI001260C02E|nr:PH domain-containing protein [Tautonia marina]
MSTTFQPGLQTEQTIYQAHPAMFRNSPIGFLICIVLIPFLGLGLLLLFVWWLNTLGTTLTVTDRRTILRKGLLSKYTNEVFHEDVRNVQVGQTFFQRIFRVGFIGISSAGQAGIEIGVNGIPSPNRVKEILDQARHNHKRSVSQSSSARSTPDTHQSATNSAVTKAMPSATPATPPPIPLDGQIENAESAYIVKLREHGQGLIDFLAYVASFVWVSRLPDWAQPIVWGLLVSVPLIVLLAISFKAIG